jgi:hypothetical protein
MLALPFNPQFLDRSIIKTYVLFAPQRASGVGSVLKN